MKHLFVLFLSALFCACDSGDIVESNYRVSASGKTLKMSARVSGMDEWGEGYSVALAGYSDESQYALMQRTLPSDLKDGSLVEMVLSNVSHDISSIELVITNKLRKRIVSLASVELEDYADDIDTIYMDLGSLDVSLLGSLQKGFFDKACVQCHGENGRKAAGLDLTAGNAYTNLVDVACRQKEGENRVVSGDASGSLIYKILSVGGENYLHYNHTEVLNSLFKDSQDEVREIIYQWISRLPVVKPG